MSAMGHPAATPLEKVIAAAAALGLNPRQHGHTWTSKCPCINAHKHGDKNPSFSIAESPVGAALVYCHAGCTTPDVVRALRLDFRDLFPDKPSRVSHIGALGQEQAVYPYHDEHGELLFEVVKYRKAEGGKTFRVRRPNPDGGWIWNRQGVRDVVYMLPQVLAAVTDGRPVIVCEGEKDAENAQWAFPGAAATCNPHGAGKWLPAHAAQLAGASEVIIVADDDPPGHNHAMNVARSLEGSVGIVRVMLPKAGHKDLTEMLHAGYGIEHLRPMTWGKAPDPPPVADDEIPYAAMLIDWTQFWDRDHAAEDWLAKPLIPAGRSIAIVAPGGTGKSLLALYVAAGIASGRGVLGCPPSAPRSVLYFDYEMTEADLFERLEAMGYGPDDDLSNLHYALLPSIDPLNTAKGAAVVVGMAEAVDAELVVIDTFSRAVEGEENDSAAVLDFYRLTAMPLKAAGRALARLDHTGKDFEKGARGSSAKRDDVDVVWLANASDNGLTFRATKRRVSWVPETVSILKTEIDDALVFTIIGNGESWPAGTAETAARLDALGVPETASRRVASDALKAAGEGARTKVIAAAQRYRRTRQHVDNPVENMPESGSRSSGTTPPEKGREPLREPLSKSASDQPGTTREPREPLDGGSTGTTAVPLREPLVPKPAPDPIPHPSLAPEELGF